MSKKHTKFVLLLDYTGGTLIKIQLTGEELKEAEKYEDFEDFLHTLEEKYEFSLRDCEWMSVNEITEREYGM
jgi:hypothetical protein